MAATVFTITSRTGFTAGVSIEVRGNLIFEKLILIRFNRDAVTAGPIRFNAEKATLSASAADFDQLVAAVDGISAGGSVDLTVFFTTNLVTKTRNVTGIAIGGPLALSSIPPGSAGAFAGNDSAGGVAQSDISELFEAEQVGEASVS